MNFKEKLKKEWGEVISSTTCPGPDLFKLACKAYDQGREDTLAHLIEQAGDLSETIEKMADDCCKSHSTDHQKIAYMLGANSIIPILQAKHEREFKKNEKVFRIAVYESIARGNKVFDLESENADLKKQLDMAVTMMKEKSDRNKELRDQLANMNFEQMMLLIQTIDLLDEFFGNHPHKTAMWFTTENPHLGESKPITLFIKDRGHKVLNFVVNQINENKRPMKEEK